MEERFSYTQNEDYTLLILIKQGDKKAFSHIYGKYHQYLYAIAFKYLKNRDLAEDAVQHVFIKLWENSKNMNVQISLRNYLYTMIKNYIINQIRNRKDIISIHYMNAQEEPFQSENITTKIEEEERITLLRQGLDYLPAQKREVCRLKLEEEANNNEIAAKMGISVNTVKSHYQESVKMLKSYFKKIKLLLF